MEVVTIILGGIIVSLTSGVIGKAMGENGTIKDKVCGERQHSCKELIFEKIDNLSKNVEALTRAINNKL